MTEEELKAHCEKQVKMCEEWAKGNGREPSGKIYEEHKLILDLINALEQQPSEDCVSRTQAIEWIENLRQMDKCFGNYEDDYFPLSEVIDRLKNVPPVTPTHGTCTDCKYNIYAASDCYRKEYYYCKKHDLKGVEIGKFYCADFEKRGNENEVN